MPDLSVDFVGMYFPNPFMLASAPPTRTAKMIKRAFAAGWGGAVTKTIAFAPTKDPSPASSHCATVSATSAWKTWS